MKTPAQIIETLTPDAIANRLNVSKLRVLRARYETELPASWYAGIVDMAIERGLEPPRRRNFAFKGEKA